MLGLAFFAAALASQPVAADTPEDPDCGGNTMQMVACANRAFERAERALQAVVAEEEAAIAAEERANPDDLSPTRLEAFQNAQRTWAAWRDAECTQAANDEARGGTMYPLIYIGCRTDMTQNRTEELRAEPGE